MPLTPAPKSPSRQSVEATVSAPKSATLNNPMHEAPLHMAREQIMHQIHGCWSRLTSDELALYDINRDQFYQAVQTKYGTGKEDIARQLGAIEEHCVKLHAPHMTLAA